MKRCPKCMSTDVTRLEADPAGTIKCYACGVASSAIAFVQFEVVDAAGSVRPVNIWMYSPVQRPDGDWHTLVSCVGVEEGSGWYTGESSLRSLALALRILPRLLKGALLPSHTLPNGMSLELFINCIFHSHSDET